MEILTQTVLNITGDDPKVLDFKNNLHENSWTQWFIDI